MENKDLPSATWGLCARLCCRVFSGRGIEYDVSLGGLQGLIKAAAHFDPDRGYKFSTYAVPRLF